MLVLGEYHFSTGGKEWNPDRLNFANQNPVPLQERMAPARKRSKEAAISRLRPIVC